MRISFIYSLIYSDGIPVNQNAKKGVMFLLLKQLLIVLILVYCFNSSLIYCEEQQSPATYEQPFASILLTTLLNGKALLPCDITPSTIEDQVVLILWYKDDQLTPIFTLDARSREGNLENGRVLSSPFLEGRAYFNVHSRPAHLQIEPIQPTDAGDYRCRVDFKKARTFNTVIALKVIVPPSDPKIYDSDGNQLSGIVGPFNEGIELTLKCSTRGGKPRPSLSWSRDYVIIDDTFEYDDREVTTNELTISPLSRHYLLSILICEAINSNITNPTSTSITLNMNLKPTEVRITQLTPILVANNEALFECITLGSRPKPTLHWIFDGKRYDTRSRGEQQTSTTLSLTVERQHRGAVLKCVAQNSKIPNSAISDQIKLDIHYAPQLSLKLGTSTMSLENIREGIDIYFDCVIDANPRPTAPIVWIFNGNVLHPQPGIIETNQSLVLQRVNRWQSGTYQCQSSNRLGTALSNAIQLKIRFAPVCRQTDTLVYGISLNESVLIECEVDAYPSQVSFQWKFETNTNLATFSQINDSSSVLSYRPHASQQYGFIECIAKNSIGMQRESCKYLIIPSFNPYFPFKCHVINQSDSTLTINCNTIQTKVVNQTHYNNHNYNYSNKHNSYLNNQFKSTTNHLMVYPPTYYVCDVYNQNHMKLIDNVSIDAIKHRLMSHNSSFNLLIENLPPNTRLRLRIYAKNSKNQTSSELEINTQTLRSAERLIDFNDDQLNRTNDFLMTKLRGQHLIITVLIVLAVVSLIVIIMAIIAVFRVRYSSSSIQLRIDGQEDDGRDVRQVETILNNETDDECASHQTLLKSDDNKDTNLLNGDEVNGHKSKSSTKEAPDLIPVPYYVNCSHDSSHKSNSGFYNGSDLTYKCGSSSDYFLDDKNNTNYFEDYKNEDTNTKNGRLCDFNKSDNKANQLNDFKNVLCVNLTPNCSKQMANVSL